MSDTAVSVPSNRLLVSSQRNPMSYLSQCKRHLQEHGEVQLSALGVAISSLVTVAEILKTRELAVEKKITTLLETRQDSEEGGKSRQKPKMEMTLVKSEKFNDIMAAEANEGASKKEEAKEEANGNGEVAN